MRRERDRKKEIQQQLEVGTEWREMRGNMMNFLCNTIVCPSIAIF